MDFTSKFLFSLRYIFKSTGMFELIEFDANGFSFGSFEMILNEAKQNRFFESSAGFLKFAGTGSISPLDEYGNFNFTQIDHKDYKKISCHELESEMFINPVITEVLKLHIHPSEQVYQLHISFQQKEKLAITCIWENFKSFIAVDEERKVLQLIAAGKD